jgi:hypothetical protein
VNPAIPKRKYKEQDFFFMTRGLEEAKHEQGCFQWRIGSEMETIKKPVFTQVVEGEEGFEKDRPTALNIMNPQMELETLSINQTFRMNC